MQINNYNYATIVRKVRLILGVQIFFVGGKR